MHVRGQHVYDYMNLNDKRETIQLGLVNHMVLCYSCLNRLRQPGMFNTYKELFFPNEISVPVVPTEKLCFMVKVRNWIFVSIPYSAESSPSDPEIKKIFYLFQIIVHFFNTTSELAIPK